MNSTVDALKNLYLRDLDRLEAEINAYKNEEDLWKISGDIINSPGNLVLHICGNLKHFIGAIIGKTGYIRNRSDEFNLKGLSRKELIRNISDTKTMLNTTLGNMDPELLDHAYPLEVFGSPMSYAFFLIHLNGHLNWHMGHVNYHRRILGY